MTTLEQRSTDPSRWLDLGLLVLVTGGVLALAIPALTRFVPPCPIHALTGLYCPGCGSGRAVMALLRGDVMAAFGYNPLAMVALLPTAYALASVTLEAFGLPAPPRPRVAAWWGWALLGAIAVFWVARNVPVWPLSMLAP